MKTTRARQTEVVETATIGAKSMDALMQEWAEWEPIKRGDVVPPGWLTVREISKARNRSVASTDAALKAGVESGAIDRKVFHLPIANALRPTAHYRIKRA